MRYDDDLVAAFVHWTWMRALLHRGWWLVTSVYLVVDAGLTAAQLVLIGSAQGIFALVCEVPAGVLADTISRKWSLVVSQLLMGTAMLATGLVTSFPLLVATQVLWGVSWTFASGADVAWITDELTGPAGLPDGRSAGRISAVLSRAARAELTGSATGLLGIGVLAWATRRDLVIILAGSAMLLLTCYVIVRFSEEHFVPLRTARWSTSWSIFQRGLALVRRSPAILRIFLATFLINGASDAAGRLAPKQLLDLGLPTRVDPVIWLTGLGVVALLIGAVALRLVARRVDGPHAAVSYAVAAAVGGVGMIGLAFAPDSVAASTCLLLVSGIAVPLTRIIGVIWVNSRTTSEVRATVHSFLAQAEYLGEVTCGLGIALIATLVTLPVALGVCAGLFAVTATVMRRAPVSADLG
ncbi:MFS transporter [Kribbella monticola]|uniref:MFS transporter n=1 Tax=Kribbella monticola TaxID=2185285 RepID=UPI001E5FFDD5|nr:MFS transporter [Kribbella monticola]